MFFYGVVGVVHVFQELAFDKVIAQAKSKRFLLVNGAKKIFV